MSFTANILFPKIAQLCLWCFFFLFVAKDFIPGLKLVEGFVTLSDPAPQPHPRVFLHQSQGVEGRKKTPKGKAPKEKKRESVPLPFNRWGSTAAKDKLPNLWMEIRLVLNSSALTGNRTRASHRCFRQLCVTRTIPFESWKWRRIALLFFAFVSSQEFVLSKTRPAFQPTVKLSKSNFTLFLLMLIIFCLFYCCRHLPMIAAQLRGRVHLKSKEFTNQQHLLVFSHILALLDLLRPHIFKQDKVCVHHDHSSSWTYCPLDLEHFLNLQIYERLIYLGRRCFMERKIRDNSYHLPCVS